MKKLHGLVISWFYPPGNSSEGLVTYKLLKNSSFSYDVFTRGSQNETVWDRDVEEDSLIAKNVKIIKSKQNTSQAWIREAVEYFNRNKDKYDFIMTRIMPSEAHEAGIIIKQNHPDVKWIASFGDPLVDSPYVVAPNKHKNPYLLNKYIERERTSKVKAAYLAISPTRIMRKHIWSKERMDRVRWVEKYRDINDAVFDLADLLIFNNPYQESRAFNGNMERYRGKGIVINHSFDEDLYKKAPEKSDKKLHFVYVGHLDKMRSATSLLKAIAQLATHDEHLVDKVVFDFYGNMYEKDKLRILDNHIYNIVRVHDNINYLESLEKISAADWSILIDANLNSELDEYIFFPAKLADYLGAKKSIFAITQINGATADIMRAIECGQIVTHSVDDIYLYLSKIIYQGYMPTKYNQKELAKYNAKNVAKRFDDAVVELLK